MLNPPDRSLVCRFFKTWNGPNRFSSSSYRLSHVTFGENVRGTAPLSPRETPRCIWRPLSFRRHSHGEPKSELFTLQLEALTGENVTSSVNHASGAVAHQTQAARDKRRKGALVSHPSVSLSRAAGEQQTNWDWRQSDVNVVIFY